MMLSETDVISAVCKKLESLGYKTRQRLKATERRSNILAVKEGTLPIELYIEAKGETTKVGKKIESDGVEVNVAEALYKVIAILSIRAERDQVMVGVAFPENKEYQRYVHIIKPVLNQLGVAVFWVRQKGTVEIASPWGV